ncbi:MAG: chemotaxis protein [Oscillospiraceae bacterium]|jgi:two-component system chemotaxis response regulator CheV|nr:chemotaxis protein [Oscillospiraceae bacterium]
MIESNILLDSGTNELEVLEFAIAGNQFGINVAKITELMQIHEAQPMPNSHPCIEGIFQPRNEVYTVVDLARYLNLSPSENPSKDIYIITNFNQMNVAFHVHAVESIHRISWNDIEKPDTIIYGGDEGVVTGIAKIEDHIVSILDFEKITFDISPQTGIDLSTISAHSGAGREHIPVLVAEDSALLRKMITQALRTSGFTNITMTTNGEEAWNFLQGLKEHPDEPLADHVRIVITDIEMPKMDGHRLCKSIKSDKYLSGLPVIIFSSLIDPTMEVKGREVGADAQLSKPEIAKLVDLIAEILESIDKE